MLFFNIIFQAVLDDWIETYNEDREGAMVDLVQFVVQCCGCKGNPDLIMNFFKYSLKVWKHTWIIHVNNTPGHVT